MIPISLTISGFTSYRDPVEIDFSELDLVCISGNNGSGKSSLLDAITYALYGQARKRDEAIINHACQKAEVILVFDYEGQTYRIVRSITRGKGSQVDFFILNRKEDGSHWKVLTERTASETNALIEKTLRLDYETFINASFFLQGKADSFSTQKPSDRKKILGSILGLDQWEVYRARAAELIREKQNQVRLRDSNLEEVQRELDEEPQRKAQLSLLEEQEKAAVSQVSAAQAVQKTQKAVEQKIAAQKSITNLLAGQLKSAQAALGVTIKRLGEKQAQLHQIQSELDHAEEIESAYQQYLALRDRLSAMDKTAEQAQPYQEKIQKLHSKLEVRKTELTNDVKHLQDEQTDIMSEVIGVSHLEQNLSDLTEEITLLRDQLNIREELELDRTSLQSEIADKKAENLNLKAKMKELRERLDKIQLVEGAVCPLCGQPLSGHDKETLKNELEVEGKRLGDQYRSNEAVLETLLQKQTSNTGSLTDLRKKEETLQSRSRESDRLMQQIDQIRKKQSDWEQNKAQKLSQLQNELAEEQFLPEIREELLNAETRLAILGYDPEKHSSLRTEEIRTRSALDAKSRLDIDQNTLGQLQESLEDLEIDKGKQEEELALKKHEYDLAAEQLNAEMSELPEEFITDETVHQLQEKVAVIQRQVGGARQNLMSIERARDRKVSLRAEREDLNLEISRFRQLERAFSKDGVPAMLIEQALPELEDQANDILGRLSNYALSIHFNTQREYKDAKRDDKKETLDILISDGFSTRDYETFSGGEAFRINFAIRLALSRVLSQRAGAKLQTLVIDEGFSNQDAEGRQRLIEAINLVQHDFARILVITHIDELKEAFPARIEVTKSINGSKVSVIPG